MLSLTQFPLHLVCVVLLAGLAAAATNHQIIVGGAAGKQFSPNNIQAPGKFRRPVDPAVPVSPALNWFVLVDLLDLYAVGDSVTFIFEYMNHTVTQSSFATPCQPLVNGTQTGFNSGFQAVAQTATQNPAWTLEVTGPAPIWFYCAQTGTPSHCQSGMVGAINAAATGNKTFAAFQAAAMGAAGGASASGAGTPTGLVGSGVGADASGAISTAPAPSGTAGASASATGSSGVGTLGVSGALVALAVIAGGFVVVG